MVSDSASSHGSRERPGHGQVNMPAAEVDVTADLVRRLLADQHPDLADEPLQPLANGWDNVLYRVGASDVVRLPRRQGAASLIENEQRWLPILGPRLPLAVPVPTRVGRPTNYYPWSWSIQPWLPGSPVGTGGWSNPARAAGELGRFLAALHTPAPDDRPVNVHRGGPLSQRHEMTVKRIEQFSHQLKLIPDRVLQLWDRCRNSAPWTGPPTWIHGDLHLFNIIEHQQELAVIDFGDICGGDPACDLAVGWAAFAPPERLVFRAANGAIDDATWMRARGWCLSIGFTMVSFSADNPGYASLGKAMVNAALKTSKADD